MRSHRFVDSLLYLTIQQVSKKENPKKQLLFTFLFVLFIDERLMALVIPYEK